MLKSPSPKTALRAGLRRGSSLGALALEPLAIRRHHRGAAEAQVVLERDLGARHLALVGLAAQLPVELCALREARGAERMALRDQAARRVHHHLTTVGLRARVDELARLALRAQA